MREAKRIARKLIKAFEEMARDGTLEEMFRTLAQAEKNRRKEQQHRPLFDRKYGQLACQV